MPKVCIMEDIINTTLTTNNYEKNNRKNPNGNTSQIFKSCSQIINQIVAYDNDSWSDEFHEAVQDAIKALQDYTIFRIISRLLLTIPTTIV